MNPHQSEIWVVVQQKGRQAVCVVHLLCSKDKPHVSLWVLVCPAEGKRDSWVNRHRIKKQKML